MSQIVEHRLASNLVGMLVTAACKEVLTLHSSQPKRSVAVGVRFHKNSPKLSYQNSSILVTRPNYVPERSVEELVLFVKVPVILEPQEACPCGVSSA